MKQRRTSLKAVSYTHIAMITGFTGNIWWLAGGMILIAVLANITAFWRIWHCYVVRNSRK